MADSNGSRNGHSTSLRLKTGLAEMLKGGVIWTSPTPGKQKSQRKPGRLR
jgi:hypothetical protein